jgi:GGDEF domain-containing protein
MRRASAQTVVMVELTDALHWSRVCGYSNSEMAIKTWITRLRQQVPASVVIARIDQHRFVLLWPLPASAVNNQLQGLAMAWTRWHLPLPEHLQPIAVAMSLTVGQPDLGAEQVLSHLDGLLYLQQHPAYSEANVASVEISDNAALLRL